MYNEEAVHGQRPRFGAVDIIADRDDKEAGEPRDFQTMIRRAQRQAFDVCIDRQRKYGPRNITRPADPIYALAVRMGDKLARLEHLAVDATGANANDESVEDTLVDLANYALIGLCILKGWWTADHCPRLTEDAQR